MHNTKRKKKQKKLQKEKYQDMETNSQYLAII